MIIREVEDRELVLAARKGGVEAYNALVSRWEKRLYNYLLRLAGSPDDALDLAQDVFLKGYRNLARLEDPARFGPWLFRIAHNEAMSLYRKRGRETPLESLVEAPQVAPGLSALEAGLAVEAALARLSPEQREAVLLKVCHGFKFDEIAEILSTPASTIKSRVYTALDQLRGLLSPVAGGGAAG